MIMQDLFNERVKISAHTITIKRDGKTAGMVRGIAQWSKSAPRVQFEYTRALRNSGIWNMANEKPWLNLLDSVIITDKKLYFIANLRVFADNTEFCNRVANAGITVIPCYID